MVFQVEAFISCWGTKKEKIERETIGFQRSLSTAKGHRRRIHISAFGDALAALKRRRNAPDGDISENVNAIYEHIR